VTQDFTSHEGTYICQRLTFGIFFKPLLTGVMIKSVDTLVTTKMFPMTCSSWALFRD